MIAWFDDFEQLGWNNAGRITKFSKICLVTNVVIQIDHEQYPKIMVEDTVLQIRYDSVHEKAAINVMISYI